MQHLGVHQWLSSGCNLSPKALTPAGLTQLCLQRIAMEVGCLEGSGAAAERMYRSLTDPAYVKASNKHGKRINPRRGSIPTHIMAAYALCRLPRHEGNLREISQEIEVRC